MKSRPAITLIDNRGRFIDIEMITLSSNGKEMGFLYTSSGRHYFILAKDIQQLKVDEAHWCPQCDRPLGGEDGIPTPRELADNAAKTIEVDDAGFEVEDKDSETGEPLVCPNCEIEFDAKSKCAVESEFIGKPFCCEHCREVHEKNWIEAEKATRESQDEGVGPKGVFDGDSQDEGISLGPELDGGMSGMGGLTGMPEGKCNCKLCGEIEKRAKLSDSPPCPECGKTNAEVDGVCDDTHTQYLCPCGRQFTVADRAIGKA